MAKSIRRTFVTIFLVILSCLLLVGCTSVSKLEIADNANSNVAENMSTNNSGNINKILTADKEYILAGDTDEMAQIWAEATEYSLQNQATVKVTLANDWLAHNDEKHSFGFGYGMDPDLGIINIEFGADIIIDLNGFDINRGFTEKVTNYLPCLFVRGKLSVMDSEYDKHKQEIETIYNENKTDRDSLISKLKAINCGRITGGSTQGSGGAINTSNNNNFNPEINIYGGMLTGNYGVSGTVNVYPTATLNFYDGLIIDNQTAYGGGVHSAGGTLNMYGGIIAGNVSTDNGGGIHAGMGSTVNVYNGIITNNTAEGHGSGIYTCGKVNSSSQPITPVYFNMYNGKITYNYGGSFGGGITLYAGTIGKIYDCEITHNQTSNDTAGILLYQSELEIFDGLIANNILDKKIYRNGNSGGAIGIVSYSKLTMHGGIIENNKAINNHDKTNYVGGLWVNGGSKAYLGDVIIRGNSTEFQTKGSAYMSAGGVGISVDSNLYLIKQPQIYDNYIKENGVKKDSDVHLLNNKRINVENLLYSTNSYARIGIDLDDGFTALESGEKVFTYNYAFSGNHYSNAGKTFFSNKTNETVVYKSYNGQYEACIKTTTAAQLPKAYWKWGGSEDDQTYDPLVKVPYTGNPYVITNTSGKIARVGIDTQVDSFSATEVGKYAFYSSSVNISNQVFTFEILPVEVDIKWSSNEFIYNGGLQKPTAYIEEDPNCKVTVVGEKIESGSGYVATAIELSNKNYKINPASINCYYSIAKAILNKPVGNEAFEYTGAEQTYKPDGFEERTMAITGNSATEVGKYQAVISLKDKKNYVWADGTNGDITIEYAITGVPVVEKGEYKFIYEDENGKRKTYAEGGYVHGVNDSTLNKGKAILGNIAPYTSVNEFVEKLGYNPSKLTIYNSNNYKIYENGNAASGVDSSVLDKKYELAVGTGWYIDYTLDNGTSERIYLSVLGDISGDGRVNSVDITNIRGLISNSENYNNLTEAQKLASLVDNKGTISVVDIYILKAYINGDIDIKLYF